MKKKDNKVDIEDFSHNSTTGKTEPAWSSIMSKRSRLPDAAFANRNDRKWPHHFIQKGSGEDEDGRYTEGKMLLHRKGLSSAWGVAASGARGASKAPQSVINHLKTHRRALGLDDE